MIASILFIIFVSSVAGQMLGPADITLQRFEKCGENKPEMEDIIEVSFRKINRADFGISLCLNLPFPMDNEFGIYINVAKWGDGGWKPNYYDKNDSNACEFIKKYIPKTFEDIANLWNLPVTCPVKKVANCIKDYVVDTNLEVPLVYGEFKVDVFFTKNDEVVSCVRGFVKIAAKMPKFG